MHECTHVLPLPRRRPTGSIERLLHADTEIADRLLADRLKVSLFGATARPITMGGYRLIERLGAGGMGVVYRAHDPELDRPVAIKLMHPDLTGAADRLRREARALGRLAHPNVVNVHEIGEHEGQLFVAMEYVEGKTLRAALAELGPPAPRSLAAVVELFLQAARGLQAAHAAGLVHCDFKPENVLVGADGRVRVADFGIASPIGAAAGELSRTAELGGSTRSVAGELIGTPAYMAPEQFRGEALDARVDQFALCVALHEALAGERPFAGDTLPALIDAVLAGAIRPLPRWVPRPLRALVARGLARDPAQRFADMAALVWALEAILRAPAWRRGGAFAAAVLAAAGSVLLALPGEPPPAGGVVVWAAGQVPTLCVRELPVIGDQAEYRAELERRHRTVEDAFPGSREHFERRAELAALELTRAADPQKCRATAEILDEEPTPRAEAELRCLLARRCEPVEGVICPEGLVARGPGGCQPESMVCAARGLMDTQEACLEGSPACCVMAYMRALHEREALGGVPTAEAQRELLLLAETGCAQGFASLCLKAAEVGLDPTEADRRACALGNRVACERAPARP